jgi:hypothetical protein
MGHDTLDFTVTIHVPQGAVTTAGQSVILLMEQRLLAEETKGPFDYDGKLMDNVRAQIGMELAHRAGTQGMDYGTKVEVSNIDIIWADDDNPDAAC